MMNYERQVQRGCAVLPRTCEPCYGAQGARLRPRIIALSDIPFAEYASF